MKPFSIYHAAKESIGYQQEKLVSVILKIVKPDMIYLLGASLYRRRSESIFCMEAPSSQQTGDYYFLILLSDFNNKEQYELQDQVEHYCSTIIPVTTIILKTSTFIQWLSTGHSFAKTVRTSATVTYDAGNIAFTTEEETINVAEPQTREKIYREGLYKAKEFYAGGELFKVRKQYSIAAFMLHQSAEQALRTILKIGTGYHCSTHSLDRLIRYASMVCYQLPDIFPKESEKDKRYFKLLQKAYSDSRYTEDYKINLQEVLYLTAKVATLIELLDGLEKNFY